MASLGLLSGFPVLRRLGDNTSQDCDAWWSSSLSSAYQDETDAIEGLI